MTCVHIVNVTSEVAQLQSMDMIKEQGECDECTPVITYLSTDELLPDDDEKARKILLTADHFLLKKGVLYHLYEPR